MNNPRAGQPQRRDPDDQHRESLRRIFGSDYVKTILEPSEEGYDGFLDRVKTFVQQNARNITTHQLRNIFSRVKHATRPHDLSILRPQLAYVAGRSDKWEMRMLVVLLDDLIRAVDERRLEAFKRFYEAIIAYHKYYDIKGS
jgi:CRISPR type III-A-associated protein Csm2